MQVPLAKRLLWENSLSALVNDQDVLEAVKTSLDDKEIVPWREEGKRKKRRGKARFCRFWVTWPHYGGKA